MAVAVLGAVVMVTATVVNALPRSVWPVIPPMTMDAKQARSAWPTARAVSNVMATPIVMVSNVSTSNVWSVMSPIMMAVVVYDPTVSMDRAVRHVWAVPMMVIARLPT